MSNIVEESLYHVEALIYYKKWSIYYKKRRYIVKVADILKKAPIY
ncbi:MULTISPECIES: hypothetical protein [Bacillus]|nr:MULTISPECIES: hypothetical protein [unclassified Bacillus (in: firmicutes)]